MPLLIRSPRFSDFDYDNITLREWWPWYKGVLFLTAGCLMAGFENLFDWSPEAPWIRRALTEAQV